MAAISDCVRELRRPESGQGVRSPTTSQVLVTDSAERRRSGPATAALSGAIRVWGTRGVAPVEKLSDKTVNETLNLEMICDESWARAPPDAANQVRNRKVLSRSSTD